jgi:hypothetical protein
MPHSLLYKGGPSGLVIPPPFGSPVASYHKRPLGSARSPRDEFTFIVAHGYACPQLQPKTCYESNIP